MEDSLSLRKANRKAILEGIARRDAHLLKEGNTSYAAAVKRVQEVATPVSIETPLHQTQTINPPHQPGSQNAFTAAPTANHSGKEVSIEEGWITVTRRKHRSLEKKRTSAPKLNKHIELLKAQGRCYRCLDRGHTQLQCRNGIRCNNCRGVGHMARACTIQKNLPTNTPLAPQQKTTFPTKQNLKAETTTMDLDNWETMPMLSPDLIIPRPRPEPRVFFPPNDNLCSPNTLLHRSALVLLGPRTDLPHLPQRIANAIAATFDCHPADFKVSPLHPAVGNFMVEFPSNTLCNMAVHIGVFMIARGIEVQLREWSPNLGMVRDPTSHKVRIKIHALPTQYWNIQGVSLHLLSGYGFVERIAPVISNGNFETLKSPCQLV